MELTARNNGMTILVDDADAELVMAYTWTAERSRHTWYAITGVRHADGGRWTTLRMHRLILGLPPRPAHIDHVNGNGLDNRRSNLRLSDAARNGANRDRVKPTARSPYRGVVRLEDSRRTGLPRYRAVVGGTYIGIYPTAEEAARAFDVAALARYGDHARLNFP